MLDKAISKIKAEMNKENNPYVKVVGEFLLNQLNASPEIAEKINVEGKTILKSLDEMRKAAEKKKVGNCAVLTDQEGFDIVLKYFGINSKAIVEESKQAKPKLNQDSNVPEKSDIDFDVKLEDLL